MFLIGISKNKRCILIFALLFMFIGMMFSQNQDPKKTSPLSECRIPVFAVDKSGKPVTELKKEDIELLVDGKTVEVSSLKKMKGEEENKKVVFFILDAMFCSNYGVKKARQIVVELVRDAPAGNSFTLLVNSVREGLIHIFGPESNKDLVMKKVKKAKIFPGSTWFKDMFSRRKPSQDRFSASSDFKVNQYMAPDATENKATTLINQYIPLVRRFSAKTAQIQYGLQMVGKHKILYYFSEGFQEKEFDQSFDNVGNTAGVSGVGDEVQATPSSTKQDTGNQMQGLKLSGALSEYFRKMIEAFKNSSSVVYVINPGKLKTMNYSSSGAMNLEYLAGGKSNYFQGLNTEKVVKNILNNTASCFELSYMPEAVSKREYKIEIRSKKENVYLNAPYLRSKRSYSEMNEREKKMYALNIAIGGILPRIAGKVEESKFRKQRSKTEEGKFQYDIEVEIPEMMQNNTGDIFIISHDKKAKGWRVIKNERILSPKEKITVIVNDEKKTDLYFAIVNTESADAIYSKIN